MGSRWNPEKHITMPAGYVVQLDQYLNLKSQRCDCGIRSTPATGLRTPVRRRVGLERQSEAAEAAAQSQPQFERVEQQQQQQRRPVGPTPNTNLCQGHNPHVNWWHYHFGDKANLTRERETLD